MSLQKNPCGVFYKVAALRSAPRLSAKGGQFDARSVRSVFVHVHAAPKTDFILFRACGRETLRGFLIFYFRLLPSFPSPRSELKFMISSGESSTTSVRGTGRSIA